MSNSTRTRREEKERKARKRARRQRASAARKSRARQSGPRWSDTFRTALGCAAFCSAVLFAIEWHDYHEAAPWTLESVTVWTSGPTGYRCDREWWQRRRISGGSVMEYHIQYRSIDPPSGLSEYFGRDQCGPAEVGAQASAVRIPHEDYTIEVKMDPPRDLQDVVQIPAAAFAILLPGAFIGISAGSALERRFGRSSDRA
jgi:hypothetical protein